MPSISVAVQSGRHYVYICKLDGCNVWNAHNTVFGMKRSAICAEAVYSLHSTMASVTCLQLSDVSVICRVTYLQFPIQACFSSTSVSQAAQRHTWSTQYQTSDVAENFGKFLVRSVQTRGMTLN